MTRSGRSPWPATLLLGVFVSLLVGGAVAVAAPSDEGRPWWHEDEPQRVTGTVLAVDEEQASFTLDGLLTYDPPRAGLGTLVVSGPAELLERVRADETVDVVVERRDGRWWAVELVLLDTD